MSLQFVYRITRWSIALHVGPSCHKNHALPFAYDLIICGQVTREEGDRSYGECYLGVFHKRYLWWVHVTRRGPGVEFLCGHKASAWEVLFSTGRGMSRRAGHRLAPHEEVLFGHLKDWYVL